MAKRQSQSDIPTEQPIPAVVNQTPATTAPVQPKGDLGAKPAPIKFATPKTIKGKTTRPKCDREGCKLYVMEGHAQCVNHVPAISRLTEDEFEGLTDLLLAGNEVDPDTRKTLGVLVVELAGWFKVKKAVEGQDVTLLTAKMG